MYSKGEEIGENPENNFFKILLPSNSFQYQDAVAKNSYYYKKNVVEKRIKLLIIICLAIYKIPSLNNQFCFQITVFLQFYVYFIMFYHIIYIIIYQKKTSSNTWEEIFRNYDKNNDGNISAEDFQKFALQNQKINLSLEEIKKITDVFDENGTTSFNIIKIII